MRRRRGENRPHAGARLRRAHKTPISQSPAPQSPDSGGVSAPTSSAMGGDIEQMAQRCRPTSQNKTRIYCARLRHLKSPARRSTRERKRMLLIHRRHIIQPVKIGHRLQIGLVCSISFSVPRCKSPICGSTRSTNSPSSSITRRRDAMRSRMLRPEIDGERCATCAGERAMIRANPSRPSSSALSCALVCCVGAPPPTGSGKIKARENPAPAAPAHKPRAPAPNRHSAAPHGR